MNDQDPVEALRAAVPDTEPPPPSIDLDRAVRDGYRARYRGRAVLGGATTVGVAGIAAVLAFTAGLLPGLGADGTETDRSQPDAAENTTTEDPAMAGYPDAPEGYWSLVDDGDNDGSDPSEAAQEDRIRVQQAATEAFGQLLADAGVWDDPLNPVLEEDCSMFEDTPEIIDACEEQEGGLAISANQRPGNYGQVYLRGYHGGETEEIGGTMGHLRDVFSFELLAPGGWTDEPGPITEQVFPQHLISDGPYYTDDAPEFSSTELDDGRTLMVADHGCAYDLAVVYPNGTGLRVTWDVDCEGTSHPVDLDALTEAVTSMPEFEFDTSELMPVDELTEVPAGWVYDRDEWANDEESQSQARATYEGAREALQELYPEATLSEGDAVSLGQMYRGANMQHSYSANGTLPFETTVDETTEDTYFELRYYLPGGWIPGYSETGGWDPHLTVCKEEFECTTETDEDGTVWAFEEADTGYEENGETYTEHEIYVTRYSPDGWAVGTWASLGDGVPLDAEAFKELLSSMPAPTFDEEAQPEIPAG